MLGYPFRTIGKDGGDQTLARPGIQQNGGPRVFDPSPIAGKGGYPSRRFFFSQRSRDSHKTSASHLFGLISSSLEEVLAFIDGEEADDVTESIGDGVEAACGSLSQKRLEF